MASRDVDKCCIILKEKTTCSRYVFESCATPRPLRPVSRPYRYWDYIRALFHFSVDAVYSSAIYKRDVSIIFEVFEVGSNSPGLVASILIS